MLLEALIDVRPDHGQVVLKFSLAMLMVSILLSFAIVTIVDVHRLQRSLHGTHSIFAHLEHLGIELRLVAVVIVDGT